MTGLRTNLCSAALAAWMAFAGAHTGMAQTSRENIRVFYVPIGMETLKPVTSENIEKRGRACLIEATGAIKEIRKILAEAQPPARPEQRFTNTTVRVKIAEAQHTAGRQDVIALVEDDGLSRIGDKDYVLSRERLLRLKRLIESSCP